MRKWKIVLIPFCSLLLFLSVTCWADVFSYLDGHVYSIADTTAVESASVRFMVPCADTLSLYEESVTSPTGTFNFEFLNKIQAGYLITSHPDFHTDTLRINESKPGKSISIDVFLVRRE